MTRRSRAASTICTGICEAWFTLRTHSIWDRSLCEQPRITAGDSDQPRYDFWREGSFGKLTPASAHRSQVFKQ